jgi:hypothetical protein
MARHESIGLLGGLDKQTAECALNDAPLSERMLRRSPEEFVGQSGVFGNESRG